MISEAKKRKARYELRSNKSSSHYKIHLFSLVDVLDTNERQETHTTQDSGAVSAGTTEETPEPLASPAQRIWDEYCSQKLKVRKKLKESPWHRFILTFSLAGKHASIQSGACASLLTTPHRGQTDTLRCDGVSGSTPPSISVRCRWKCNLPIQKLACPRLGNNAHLVQASPLQSRE